MPSVILLASAAFPLKIAGMISFSRVALNWSQTALKSPATLASAPVMPASTESSLVLAACTFALSASCADLSLAFIIDHRALRAFTRAAQASRALSAHAPGANASPRPSTAAVVTAVDWLVMDGSLLQGERHPGPAF